MELDEYWGCEIFLQGRRWEVFTPDGALLAEGRGRADGARRWIREEMGRRVEQLCSEQPTRSH